MYDRASAICDIKRLIILKRKKTYPFNSLEVVEYNYNHYSTLIGLLICTTESKDILMKPNFVNTNGPKYMPNLSFNHKVWWWVRLDEHAFEFVQKLLL